MSLLELRTALAALLASYLGTYTRPTGDTIIALWIGQPPSDWTVAGLEASVEAVPTFDVIPAHQTSAIAESFRLRLISHGSPTSQRAAVRAVLSRFQGSTVTEIPRSEALGILAQHLIEIPS